MIGYAVRKEGYGWRPIDDMGDIKDWEVYSETKPELTQEQDVAIAQASLSKEIQLMLDGEAKKLGYENIMDARSFAGFNNTHQEEALKLSEWSARCRDLSESIANGAGEIPSVDQIISQMLALK
jgi:hypothetical protein